MHQFRAELNKGILRNWNSHTELLPPAPQKSQENPILNKCTCRLSPPSKEIFVWQLGGIRQTNQMSWVGRDIPYHCGLFSLTAGRLVYIGCRWPEWLLPSQQVSLEKHDKKIAHFIQCVPVTLMLGVKWEELSYLSISNSHAFSAIKQFFQVIPKMIGFCSANALHGIRWAGIRELPFLNSQHERGSNMLFQMDGSHSLPVCLSPRQTISVI